MIYADTNVLIAIVCDDALSAAADAWYESVSEPIAVCPWTVIEFRANIGLRVRKKEFTRAAGLTALAQFDRLIDSAFHTLAPAEGHFLKACDWLAHPECALHSGDALHLAIAFGHQCRQFVTFDQPLGAFARKLNLPVLVLKP